MKKKNIIIKKLARKYAYMYHMRYTLKKGAKPY